VFRNISDFTVNLILNCSYHLFNYYLKHKKANLTSLERRELRRSWLKLRLRKHPRWYGGHYLIAESYISDRLYREAYQAGLILNEIKPDEFEAKWVFGRVKLRLGQPTQALGMLEDLHRNYPKNQDIAAELIAALIQLGNKFEALRVLEKYPKMSRNRDLSAITSYLEGQPINS
jgi:tetratricopeptide (TPR) repeat protein